MRRTRVWSSFDYRVLYALSIFGDGRSDSVVVCWTRDREDPGSRLIRDTVLRTLARSFILCLVLV